MLELEQIQIGAGGGRLTRREQFAAFCMAALVHTSRANVGDEKRVMQLCAGYAVMAADALTAELDKPATR